MPTNDGGVGPQNRRSSAQLGQRSHQALDTLDLRSVRSELLSSVVFLKKSELGGFLQHSVYKSPSFENEFQLLMSIEPPPSLLGGLGQFEHHG